jgi:transcriptional regulator with XRE-family HTH domain
MTLGEKIRHIRRTKRRTQKELAQQIGLTKAQLSRWEQDHVVPRTRNLQDLAAALEVPFEEFQNLRASSAPLQLAQEDPEMLEIVTQISTLNQEQKRALKLVIQSMVTCQKLHALAGSTTG